MRKRERENPCGVCGHYHKYEEGEVCGVCGHRMPDSALNSPLHVGGFPSEILPDFLYLGSYDNASPSKLLKTQGITRILNAVPACQNLYQNSFTYHCPPDDNTLPFDDAIQFLEQCERDKARVLVHCMLGKNRSAAIVIAYLMKSRGWRLSQCHQWVKERRPCIDLSQGVCQQLQEYEQKTFRTTDIQPGDISSFSFGFPKPNDPIPAPAFNSMSCTSVFSRPAEIAPNEFQFGAANPSNPNGGDISMDT